MSRQRRTEPTWEEFGLEIGVRLQRARENGIGAPLVVQAGDARELSHEGVAGGERWILLGHPGSGVVEKNSGRV